MIELFRALATFTERPRSEHARLSRELGLPSVPTDDEYTELFVLQLYPYASVYVGAEGMLGGEARDRIAGFWRAIGDVPPKEPDHLAVLLALYARLGELERDESRPERATAWRRARIAFLHEHLLSWLPAYLDKLIEIAPPVYRAWGRLLEEALRSAARELSGTERLPLHLRDAPPLASSGGEAATNLAEAVLVPVRSGLIVTRVDLSRGARALGLGLRIGERRFALDGLLSQDREAVLGWLEGEAARWYVRHEAMREEFGDIAVFWADRAGQTRALLVRARERVLAGAATAEVSK
ncbi:MAG TPA: molecular chaperone TorD family protein [Gemmatimonadaceae bacterium]|nr:molecular chaperone TorD family protein [Gemmatimonadaceae bacterium]